MVATNPPDEGEREEKPLAFVAMSFKPELLPIYLKIIKPVLEAYGFECVRGDEIYESGIIIDQVLDYLDRADLVVCDLTYNNANVYYELGVAHAFNKRTILISQHVPETPFDARHQRIIEYKDDRFSLLDLRDELTRYLRRFRTATEQPEAAAFIPATPTELEAARTALYHHELNAKRYAVRFLGDYGDKTSYDRIYSLTYPDNDPELIRDALLALYRIDPERVLDDLLSSHGIWSGNYLVQERAISLLAKYKPTQYMFDQVIRQLGHYSWGVRMAVCQVLGEWGQNEAINLLKDRLVDTDPPVRAAAEEALRKIYRKNVETPKTS